MEIKFEERIKNVMSAVLQIPAEHINNMSSPDTIESWDSLKHMNLLIALEEEFDIEFTDENIIELVNMNLIMTVLKEKTKDSILR